MIHVVIIIANIICFVIFAMIVFAWIPCIPCDLPEDRINAINNLYVCIATSVVASTIFYYMNYWVVERGHQKKIRNFSFGRCQMLFDVMQYIIGYYAWIKRVETKDKTLLKLDSQIFKGIPYPTKDIITLRVNLPENSNGVGVFDGSTELGWLYYYSEHCKRFSHDLLDSFVFCMDDINIVNLINKINSSSFLSNIEIMYSNNIPIRPGGYDKSLIDFYDYYTQLAKYVNPKTIVINDRLEINNAFAIIYK